MPLVHLFVRVEIDWSEWHYHICKAILIMTATKKYFTIFSISFIKDHKQTSNKFIHLIAKYLISFPLRMLCFYSRSFFSRWHDVILFLGHREFCTQRERGASWRRWRRWWRASADMLVWWMEAGEDRQNRDRHTADNSDR